MFQKSKQKSPCFGPTSAAVPTCQRANVPSPGPVQRLTSRSLCAPRELGGGGSVGLIGLGWGSESDGIKKIRLRDEKLPSHSYRGMIIWSFQKPWNKDPYEPISIMKCHALKWLMEEILNNRLGCIKPNVNNGINYQPQLVSRISSIHSSNGKWTRIESMYFLLKVRRFSSSYVSLPGYPIAEIQTRIEIQPMNLFQGTPPEH